MTELSLTERMLLDRIEAAPAAPESYDKRRGRAAQWLAEMYGGSEYAEDHATNEHWTEMAEELLGVLGDQRPITVVPDTCPSRSHSADGWHCAITGEHMMHLNAARTVGWV
jgi:hypothetical protein